MVVRTVLVLLVSFGIDLAGVTSARHGPYAASVRARRTAALNSMCTAAPLHVRRVATVTNGRELPIYEVACTFPDRRKSVALGDIESARPICESCTYQGIFRPDSD